MQKGISEHTMAINCTNALRVDFRDAFLVTVVKKDGGLSD